MITSHSKTVLSDTSSRPFLSLNGIAQDEADGTGYPNNNKCFCGQIEWYYNEFIEFIIMVFVVFIVKFMSN